MTGSTKQIVLLVLLLGALAAVVAYQTGAWTPAAGGAPASNSPAARETVTAAAQVEDVRLERLDIQAETFTPPRRDPFRFRAKPAPPPPVAPPPPPVAARPSMPAPPQAPARAPIPLKYLGLMELPNGTRVAVLHDGTPRPPSYGRQGDVIEGQYRLLRVENDSVEIAYLDGTGRRRIPKTGQ